MARTRNIKPGFFMNDKLAEIEPLGRILFAGLWTIADREGRLEDRPKKIKAAILPYDNCDINKLLQELHDKDFIVRYEIEGEQYIAIPNWKKHQNPHIKEPESTIPEPESTIPEPYKHNTSTIQKQDEHRTSPADSLNLIPESKHMPADAVDTDDHDEKPNGAQSLTGKGQKTSAEKLGYTSEFEMFWLVYPRKIAKKRAFELWKRRTKKESPENLISAAENYAKECVRKGTELDYIKHPSTFLSDKLDYQDYLPQEDKLPFEKQESRNKDEPYIDPFLKEYGFR